MIIHQNHTLSQTFAIAVYYYTFLFSIYSQNIISEVSVIFKIHRENKKRPEVFTGCVKWITHTNYLWITREVDKVNSMQWKYEKVLFSYQKFTVSEL